MILFFLFFIVIPLLIFGAVSLALFVALTRFVISIQEKRLVKHPQLSPQQRNEKASAQVFRVYIGLFGAFILFLIARYYIT